MYLQSHIVIYTFVSSFNEIIIHIFHAYCHLTKYISDLPMSALGDIFNFERFNSLIFRQRVREGEREEEEDLGARETSNSCLSYAPQLETKHNPGMCPGQESTSNLSLCRTTPSQLSHTDRDYSLIFNRHSVAHSVGAP